MLTDRDQVACNHSAIVRNYERGIKQRIDMCIKLIQEYTTGCCSVCNTRYDPL